MGKPSLVITDISELLLIEGLLDKHADGIGFKHHQYYTNRDLLKRVRETIIEVNKADIAEEGGAK